jgi:hypothetical protein
MNISFVEVIHATSVVALKKDINDMIGKHRGNAVCIDIKYHHNNFGSGSSYTAILCFEIKVKQTDAYLDY